MQSRMTAGNGWQAVCGDGYLKGMNTGGVLAGRLYEGREYCYVRGGNIAGALQESNF